MKHKSIKVILIGLLFWMNGCEIFNRNEFIESGKIGTIENKELVYYLYQTGIDNYRFEFKIIENQDTTDLFSSYLNDATATNSTFSINEENRKIKIKSNKPLSRQEKEVPGWSFRLEGIN